MSAKNALKQARLAFRAKEYQNVIKHTSVALEQDSSSIPCLLLHARALEFTNRPDEAESAYKAAATLDTTLPDPWIGLKGIYKLRGKSGVDDFVLACSNLAERRALSAKEGENAGLLAKQEITEAIKFAKEHGSQLQVARAMELFLPSSSLYEYVSDVASPPLQTWLAIAEILEKWEQSTINKLIGERRTRLGATLHGVTIQTKRECFGQTKLDEVYQNIINWALDDTIRRRYEEKQFLRALEKLSIATSAELSEASEEVLTLARGMVIVKYPYEKAWKINIEWRDGETLDQWDFELLLEFIALFPDTGLSKVLEGYLYSPLSPFSPMEEDEKDKKREKERGVNLRDSDSRLEYMTDGLNEAKDSIMAHRLMAQYFLYRDEYELAIQTGQMGVKLTNEQIARTGSNYQDTLNGFNHIIGTALIHHNPPRNQPQARTIFNSIIKATPTHYGALTGLGQIFESEGMYEEARGYFEKALETEPSALATKIDLAWCEAMLGSFDASLPKLENYYEDIQVHTLEGRKLKVLTSFRIGRCIWAMDPTRVGRKDRRGAYSWFLSAIKLDPSFAPAYTFLGIFYLDYTNDRRRGRQCFQKAFELSTEETVAAEYLANDYADRQEWDVVELIANRVVDNGHALPPVGSNRKGLSWPFAALGVVNMNRADFHAAATKFLAALRVNPSDYNSYVGLAEAYHNSGRHNSALRAILSAQEASKKLALGSEVDWFSSYILGNICRDIGQYEEGITAYKAVLKARPGEYGVQIALLQTIVEQAFSNLSSGLTGRAASGMASAINLALNVNQKSTFNLWKAVGDACVGLAFVHSNLRDGSASVTGLLKSLLQMDIDTADYDLFSDVDKISWASLDEQKDGAHKILTAAILAYKRAIVISNNSVPSQAVGWFNLGCVEYQAYRLEQQMPTGTAPSVYLRASIRCFKRAIELESSNTDFWTALGIATSPLNPPVSQHSFIRALNINSRNAHAWASLGSLYLQESDTELAQMAFSRAISTEPEFASPWVGAGMVEEAKGDPQSEIDALANFTHALNVATQSDAIVKKKFAVASFDALLKNGTDDLLRPLFALRQLSVLRPQDSALAHLRSLYLERVGEHDGAVDELFSLCAKLEAEYDKTENDKVLARFCVAKADAARNLLALGRFQEARAWAEEAVSLIPEHDDNDHSATGTDNDSLDRVRLSGLLTQGLAAYYERDMGAALDSFRAALEQSSGQKKKKGAGNGRSADADSEVESGIMCLLAQVLWAQGGVDERVVARESLEELLDGKDGWKPMVMVGVMALLERDEPAARAVISDLEDVREKMVGLGADRSSTRERVKFEKPAGAGGMGPSDEASVNAKVEQVEKVLAALRAFVRLEGKGADSGSGRGGAPKSRRRGPDPGVLQDILAFPFRPSGWAELAAEIEHFGSDGPEAAGTPRTPASAPASATPHAPGPSSSPALLDLAPLTGTAPYVRQVAALVADRLARPRNELSADQLVAHLAAAPGVEDRLAAVVLAPWKPDGWIGLRERLG